MDILRRDRQRQRLSKVLRNEAADLVDGAVGRRAQIADAVKLYKESIRPLVMQGDLYRLVSPYEHPLASLSYVSADKQNAVVYLYQTKDGNVPQVVLGGLDANKKYRVEEVGLPKGTVSRFPANGKVFTGAELMSAGLSNPLNAQFESAVVLLKIQ